jgi:hypothetical protein
MALSLVTALTELVTAKAGGGELPAGVEAPAPPHRPSTSWLR